MTDSGRRTLFLGDDLFLLGRDPKGIRRSATDLAVRAGRRTSYGTARLDLGEPEGFAAVVEEVVDHLGGVDLAVITAADFAVQEELEEDPERARRLLEIDFSGTVTFCEWLRPHLLASRGTLCVFSSVAGDRGRKPVVLYGAAKAGLSRYLEGLDHRYHGEGLTVVCVKPGFVETSMTEGLDPPPFAGKPEAVAGDVLRAIEKGKPVVYTPGIWRWVMAVIRRLPRFVMRRVDL